MVLVVLFCLFVLPAADPDLGWQIRCGENFWKGLGFCSRNDFSVYLPNFVWTNHSWLYQAILWLVNSVVGMFGLAMLNGLVVGMAFWLLYMTVKEYYLEKLGAILVMIFLMWGLLQMGIRSQMMGYLFFNMMLWLDSRAGKVPNWLWGLPLVELIWVNSHGSFVVGLGLIGFILIKNVLEKKVGVIRAVVIGVVAGGVTWVNPFGFGVYEEAWRHFGGIDMSKLIAEWTPPVPLVWWICLLSGLGLSGWLIYKRNWRSYLELVVLWGLMYLALRVKRHVPFLLFLEFYLVFGDEKLMSKAGGWLKQTDLRNNVFQLVSVCLICLALVLGGVGLVKSIGNSCQTSQLTYPCGAVEYLKKQNVLGPIFTRYEWGGYLIGEYPRQKVFVDGRMPAWPDPSGKSPYTIYLETLQTLPGWEERLIEYKINWILISPGTFMDIFLSPSPRRYGWDEVYRDEMSVLYKRFVPVN